MGSNAEEFRKHADECYRLSVQLRNPDHKPLALYLAAAWLELAQTSELREAQAVKSFQPIANPPADPRPKDRVE